MAKKVAKKTSRPKPMSPKAGLTRKYGCGGKKAK